MILSGVPNSAVEKVCLKMQAVGISENQLKYAIDLSNCMQLP
jgi:LAS superfamily LD-carboxypeptidase LdcB